MKEILEQCGFISIRLEYFTSIVCIRGGSILYCKGDSAGLLTYLDGKFINYFDKTDAELPQNKRWYIAGINYGNTL